MTANIPDLLHPEARPRLDTRALREALTFAFATGGTAEAFSKILERSERAPSDFAAECFASDLFLGEFAARCLPVKLRGERHAIHRQHFLGLLAHPPKDPSISAFRQQVLAELSQNDELRSGAERLASKIKTLIGKLEAPDRGKRYDAIGRRIDVLRAAKEAIDALLGPFAAARSGLARIEEVALRVRASEEYAHLEHLLDHEGHLASLELRVRVSYDGELRSFEIVRATENTRNPFYKSRLGRFMAKLRLWLKGYAFRESEVLGRLANAVFDGIQDAVAMLFQLLGDLEFYLASLALRDFAASRGLKMCIPELVSSASAPSAPAPKLALEALFNPFLLNEERPPRPAELSVSNAGLVVITGPNSGGKTRLLQAIGLCQLLGQAGSFVPAARAQLPLRRGLFVSLTHEMHSDQREGRLGTELLRIRRLFERLSCGSLVILDELCSGTNPSEGEDIFELVVSLLVELEPLAFITTHFLQFAARLEREQKLPLLDFLQVELDEHKHPTYGFVPGVATTSLASRTAERLGVTREALLELVERAKNANRT